MGKVVGFPGKTDEDVKLVWHCGICGCSTFSLFSDGSCACAGCRRESEGQEWVQYLPDIPDETPEKTDAGSVISINWGDALNARNRTVEYAVENIEKIAFIGVWLHDGQSRLWENIQTKVQRDWCLRRMDELKSFIAELEFTDQSPTSADGSSTASWPEPSTETSSSDASADPEETR